jgi:acyl-CoA synthetase (AMP-forming)/AMP-acid ligase II
MPRNKNPCKISTLSLNNANWPLQDHPTAGRTGIVMINGLPIIERGGMTDLNPPGRNHGFTQQTSRTPQLEAGSGKNKRPPTVYDWLIGHAEASPDAPAVAEWRDDAISFWLTYSAATRIIDEIADGLRREIHPGDRVMLIIPTGTAFYCSFIACIAAGAVAVPSPIPGVAREAAVRERLSGIAEDCQPTLAVTHPEWAEMISAVMTSHCATVTHEDLRQAGAGPSGTPASDAKFPVALLQYTSGSTSRPRAITVTHESLRANCAQAAEAYTETAEDVGVTWVPLYHDLGLNTGIVRPLFSRYPSVLLRPDDFVKEPVTWLRAIDSCGGTISSGPNFSYDLCVRKISHENASALNLSTWRIARNAGEVVRADTVERFTAHFRAAGFAESALCTGYGLAEATLSVSTCTPQVRPLRLTVLRSDLQRGMATVLDGPVSHDVRVQPLLSSGVPLPGTQVRAGDGMGRIGPISIRGPQVLGGSRAGFGAPSRTGTDDDGWYDTGDLGFIFDGHLFVVGRADDTVIHRGRNFYLVDVTAICEKIDGLRPGRVVPFVTYDDEAATEKACIVAEVRPRLDGGALALRAIAAEIRNSLASGLEFFVTHVIFVSPGTLPVTTSGKLRASEAKRRYEEGRLSVLSVQ